MSIAKRLTLIVAAVVLLGGTPSFATECFLMQRIGSRDVMEVNAEECATKSAPASTFKIPHALIALETGVIRPGEVVKWDGTKYPFRSWQRDHTLDSAIRSSVYPFFQRTAGLIGRERMQSSLRALRYGDETFDGELTTFWTNGDLAISPRQQLDFLVRFFTYDLTASRSNVDIVKNAMMMPSGKITNAAGVHNFPVDGIVRAKTGNTRVGDDRISWLVGQVERGGAQYVFVARRRAREPLTSTAGAGVALEYLNALFQKIVLHNATVIDGTGAAPRTRADVVIDGERIVSVGPCAHPERARVIDATGKYVLPGFIDMHVHLEERTRNASGDLGPRVDWSLTRRMLSMLLEHGITTVRDPGSQTESAVTIRRMVAEGETRGPRIFTAGRILTASNFNEEPFLPVHNAQEIRDEIEWQAAAGVDFIKIYGSMPPELTRVAIEAAHAHDLPVIGHLQATTWTEAARMGIDFIAHGAPWSPEYLPAEARPAYEQTMFGRVYWLDHIDLAAAPVKEMIAELAKRRVVMDPTLIAYHTKFFGDQPRWRENRDNRLMPAEVLTGWRAGNFTRDWKPEQYAAAQKAWPKQLALTKALYDGGVILTAGTDAPTAWIVPGPSLHEEMALLRDAGIAPLQVIRIATSNAAAALHGEDEFGAVKEGWIADLVVLSASPLEKIENTRAIDIVIQRGRIVHAKSH